MMDRLGKKSDPLPHWHTGLLQVTNILSKRPEPDRPTLRDPAPSPSRQRCHT